MTQHLLFKPNWRARSLGVHEKSYIFPREDITPALRSILGDKNYSRHMIEQDPLAGGKRRGKVEIVVPNPSRPEKLRVVPIGTVEIVAS